MSDELFFCGLSCFLSSKKKEENGEKCIIIERKVKSDIYAFNIFFFHDDDKKTQKTRKK